MCEEDIEREINVGARRQNVTCATLDTIMHTPFQSRFRECSTTLFILYNSKIRKILNFVEFDIEYVTVISFYHHTKVQLLEIHLK